MKKLKTTLAVALAAICLAAAHAADFNVASPTYMASVTKTRPANTTAYDAGDVLAESASAGTVWTFADIGPTGGTVLVTSITLKVGLDAVPVGMGSFRLHLFKAPPTTLNDGDPVNVAVADRGNYLGWVDIPSPIDRGATLVAQDYYMRQQLRLRPGDTSLYGFLETVGGYTPTSQTEYAVTMHTVKLSQ